MITRILFPILIVIVLSDFYFDRQYLKRHIDRRWWIRPLWWFPGVAMAIFTIYLACFSTFIPDNMTLINTYLVLLGVVVVPKAVAALCSSLGVAWRKMRHQRRNWGNLAAFILSLGSLYICIYGFTAGFMKLKVRHVDLYFDDLPDSFDGYRLVHFSDAHVGTFNGWRKKLLQRDIDSINNQHADIILFTGDLQNIRPQELYPMQGILSSLKAKDGVVSVPGNHDYSEYSEESPSVEAANRKELIDRQRRWGWSVLLNSHLTVRRGNDSIVIAGEQNLEVPDSADFKKTMSGISPTDFVIFMQHNPKSWDRYVKADRRVRLMLSGHVHGGQIELFGWRPSSMMYHYDYGLHQESGRALYVTSGIGALVPFRFGIPAEIVVITLHKSSK